MSVEAVDHMMVGFGLLMLAFFALTAIFGSPFHIVIEHSIDVEHIDATEYAEPYLDDED